MKYDTADAFRDWLATAKPGDRRVYFEGFFAAGLAVAAASGAYRAGLVVLFQQRLTYGSPAAPGVLAYIAERVSGDVRKRIDELNVRLDVESLDKRSQL